MCHKCSIFVSFFVCQTVWTSERRYHHKKKRNTSTSCVFYSIEHFLFISKILSEDRNLIIFIFDVVTRKQTVVMQTKQPYHDHRLTTTFCVYAHNKSFYKAFICIGTKRKRTNIKWNHFFLISISTDISSIKSCS